jgi:hypothetical protein
LGGLSGGLRYENVILVGCQFARVDVARSYNEGVHAPHRSGTSLAASLAQKLKCVAALSSSEAVNQTAEDAILRRQLKYSL